MRASAGVRPKTSAMASGSTDRALGPSKIMTAAGAPGPSAIASDRKGSYQDGKPAVRALEPNDAACT